MSDYPTGNEKKFNEFLVIEYLKHGSVDEVLKRHKFDVPISYAGYQRILDKWGIIKAAGPNSKLTETVEFLTRFAYESVPFDRLYKKMPPSFKTSSATLYRVLSYIKEGLTRRLGTALVITQAGMEKNILVGEDISTPRIELGKTYRSLTIPMGFTRLRDPREDAILRVLQQEVFSQLAVEKRLPKIVPNRPKPFMILDVADVRVELFHLILPKNYSKQRLFSSFKIKNHKFISVSTLTNKSRKLNLRMGIREIAVGYEKYLDAKKKNMAVNPIYYKSTINYKLSGTS